jgi:hypothetical protein
MLNSLRIQRDVLVMEADILKTGKNAIAGVVSSFVGFSDTLASFATGGTGMAIALTSKQRSFLKEIDKHSYQNIRVISAYVPEGLGVQYIDYLIALQPSVDHCVENTVQLMTTLTNYLSNIISNDESLKETTLLHARMSKFEKDRQEENKKVGACFEKGSTLATRSIGFVISRNSDWSKVFDHAEKLTHAMNSIDRGILKRRMTEVLGLLDSFKRKAENGGIGSITPEVTANIADLLYQAACELEFFSVTYYRVQAIAGALNNTIDRLDQVLKPS